MSYIHLFRLYNHEKKIRCGIESYGGYVIADLDGGYDCYIGVGVGDEESFSRDFINKYNMNKTNSYAFDGDIDSYPLNYTENISFIKKNVSDINDDTNTDLTFLTNNHTNIFLKMDFNKSYYPWLLNVSEETLNKFKQIVVEFRGITNQGWDYSLDSKMKMIEKLSKTHYLVHVHGNNNGPIINGRFPDWVELTYVNKNCFDAPPEFNVKPLPIANLDYPNNNSVIDIDLNFYPFNNDVTTIIPEVIELFPNSSFPRVKPRVFPLATRVGETIPYFKGTKMV